MKQRFGKDFVRGGQDDDHRNFYGSALGRYLLDKDYMGITIEIELTVLMRSGYYEGCNLDYNIDIHVDGHSHDDVDYAIDEWEYQANKWNNAGLVKANKSKAQVWLENTLHKMSGEIESMLAYHCGVELVKVAQFSNGEAVYERVN
jgi:hypothetical protein